MANIKSINGNPIVLDASGIADDTITDLKLVQNGGVLSEVHGIRTGADGLSYASAGDAVQRNDKKTNDRIDQFVDRMKWATTSLFHFTDLVYGEYIARSGTTLSIEQGTSSGGYSIRSAKPIPVDASKKYRGYHCSVIEIDENGDWVASHTNYATFTPSASTVAVWINIIPSNLHKAYFSSVGDGVGTYDKDRYLIDGYDISSEPLMQTNGIVHQFEASDFQYGTLTTNNPYGYSYVDSGENRIRSNRYYLYPAGTTFSVDSSVGQLSIMVYDLNGDFVEAHGFVAMRNSPFTLSESRLIKAVLAFPDNSVIAESDFETLVSAAIVTSPRQTAAEALDKLRNYDEMRLISEASVNSVTSMTVIDGKLYVAPYADGTYDDHQTMRTGGAVYDILPDGSLSLTDTTFQHNMGHANTIDYCEGNGYLVGSSGGNSANIQPMEIYLFPNAADLTSFDVSDADTVRIDVSQEGWGKQLNCCWAWDNHFNYDLIWCLTNYQYGNMSSYDTSNANPFSGTSAADSRRYIRLVQLGKGSVDMGSGTIDSGAADDEFNGTYKVLRTYELPFNMYTFKEGATSAQLGSVDDANNDTCFYGGKLYETPVRSGRASMIVHEFEDYGETCTTKRIATDDHLETDGRLAAFEGEGMAIYRGIMYQAYNGKIQARRV